MAPLAKTNNDDNCTSGTRNATGSSENSAVATHNAVSLPVTAHNSYNNQPFLKYTYETHTTGFSQPTGLEYTVPALDHLAPIVGSMQGPAGFIEVLYPPYISTC